MIDVKLCKNCRPALERERERNMRFFHARGTFLLFMPSTDKELKAKADKLADIIL